MRTFLGEQVRQAQPLAEQEGKVRLVMARSLFGVLRAPADGKDAADGCSLGLLFRTEVPIYLLFTDAFLFARFKSSRFSSSDWSRFKDVGNVAPRNAATIQFESQA